MPDLLPYPLAKPESMPTSAYLLALLTAIVRNTKGHELILIASDILSAEGSAVTISPTGDKKGIILRVSLPGTSTFFVESSSSPATSEGGPSRPPLANPTMTRPSPPTRPQPSLPREDMNTSLNRPSRHAVPSDLDLYLKEQETQERYENSDREDSPSPQKRRNVEPGLYPFRTVGGR